jgi:hypothetical protein
MKVSALTIIFISEELYTGEMETCNCPIINIWCFEVYKIAQTPRDHRVLQDKADSIYYIRVRSDTVYSITLHINIYIHHNTPDPHITQVS